jgi:Arc/MetJ-type ribon-helix-helix transcriptional regulator
METVERIDTVVNLPKDLVEEASKDAQLSDVVEAALRALLKNTLRAERDKRELEILNSNADALNAEASDVLEYQQVNW